MARFRFLLVLWLVIIFDLQGQIRNSQGILGDKAMAEKYAAWAETAIAEGRWAEALAGLERGADFSQVSSDSAYLLALARSHENLPKGAVLEAVNQALETNRWNRYNAVLGKVLKAETLIQVCRYAEALADLTSLPKNIDVFCLRLQALKGLDERERFTKLLAEVMDAYPREPRPVRLFFEYAINHLPLDNEEDILALALKRLPLLIEADQELAYLGASFISDTEEARRLLGAYRAIHTGVPASIPPALNLGLIDGNDGVDELFRVSPGEEKKLDRSLLLEVWHLLRDDAQRDRFKGFLLNFSGIITEDLNKDGYAETQVWYKEGIIAKYVYDPDQDGIPEMTVFFEAGVPVKMETITQPDSAGSGRNSLSAYPPVTDRERAKAALQWEQYPAVRETILEGKAYKPKPFDFFFFPLYFTKLESGGLLYPERNTLMTGISPYTLIASALIIERPSKEFSGAIERVELDRGIPQKAQEFLDGRLVSETTFYLGTPVSQRIDLDGNGYLETLRHFRRVGNTLDSERIIEFSESDWNEDGIFEYQEHYIYHNEESGDFNTYQVVRSWDLDRDGVREFSDQIRYVKK